MDSLVSKQIESVAKDAALKTVQNSICKNGVDATALNHERVVELSSIQAFSTQLDQTWSVTDQKSSGRCWLFAGLNTLRVPAMTALNLKDLELSQNYVFFFDKLERANYFLTSIRATRHLPLGDRTVDYLLEHPIDDGGQWDMFAALVNKYGLVPKTAMPETFSSSNSMRFNAILKSILRDAAPRVRGCGEDEASFVSVKNETMERVVKVLVLHLGAPPLKSFTWSFMDKKDQFKRFQDITPQAFAAEVLSTVKPSEFISLVHDPRETSPAMKTFTVDFLGNVVDAPKIKYLNVGIAVIKELVVKMLQTGMPVWFGSDCGKMAEKDEGIYDLDIIEYDKVYGFQPDTLTKAQRLVFGHSKMNHAMTFTGVDVDPVTNQASLFRVENSWGDKKGRKGVFVMSSAWFDEYVFEAAIHTKFLSAELLAAFAQDPITLPAWDPMGALAL